MKRLLSVILASVLALPAFAQFAEPRQLTADESQYLNYSNACAIGAGVSLVLTGISAVGTIIYTVEADEAADHGDRPLVESRDRSYRNGFAVATAVSALSTGFLAWESMNFRNRLSGNVVLQGSNGGLALQIGGNARAMNGDELKQDNLLKALRVSTAAGGLLTLCAGTGTLIYYLEYRETIGGDLEGHGEHDRGVSLKCLAATGACALLTGSLGWAAHAVDSRMSSTGKIYVKTTVGGFVVEF